MKSLLFFGVRLGFIKVFTFAFNSFPFLAQAYVQIIERFGWKSYTILYEDNQVRQVHSFLWKSSSVSQLSN